MKRAKQLFTALRKSTGKPRRTAETPRPRMRKESSLPKRIPREQLDYVASGGFCPIDSAVISQLRTAMACTNDALLDACLQRKLLPASIGGSVNMARFLCIVMPAARAAQKITGVPASILISEVWHLAPCTLFDGLTKLDHENDYFGTGEPFSSVEASFLDHANRLSRDKKFQPVMLAKDNRAEYLRQLGSCRLWDEMGRKNRVATITGHCLQECDVLPYE
jgi:hypothetical protein